MKLNNCKSEKFISSKKKPQGPSREDSEHEHEDSSEEVHELLNKLQLLEQKQENTKNTYLSKIEQLKTILAQQNATTINLESYIKELRREN
jgi:hypothetical protein